MKKLILAVATLMATYAAFGQGQFVFNNRVPPDINARFVLDTDASGSSSVGTDGPYTVNLFNGTAALNPASTTFRGAANTATAGYVTPTTETVDGVAPGATANVTLTVVGPKVLGGKQSFGPYPVVLGGGTITPPNLALGTSPLVLTTIPEPSTLALGLLGLGALLAIRRRK
jgi:hypothetical protein